MRERLLDLVGERRDVVLDLSFWSRGMRDSYRQLLAGQGVVPETVYVRTPRALALARVAARGGEHRDDVVLAADIAARYYDQFEPPTHAEGPLTVVDGTGAEPRSPA